MGSWNMRNGLPKHEKWVPESREMGSWKTRNGFPKHDKWVPETREMGSWNTRNGFPKHGREMGSRNTRNGFQKHTPGELGSQNILHARKWFRKHIPGVMGSRNTRNRFPKIFKFNRIWFHSFLGPRQSTPLISKFSDFCIMVMVIFVLKIWSIFDEFWQLEKKIGNFFISFFIRFRIFINYYDQKTKTALFEGSAYVHNSGLFNCGTLHVNSI